MSDSKITLYSYRRCPFAIRVRMTLHEKGIEFQTVEENLKDFSEELRKLHPEVKVPVLIHGERIIYESAIITEYLDECFGDPKLMPSSPGDRCEARLWTYWTNHLFKPEVDRFKYGTSRFPENECVGSKERLLGHLQKLENGLKDTDWLVGNKFSLADIHVFPFYRQLSRINPQPEILQNFPRINTWLESIVNRPAFEKVMKKPPKTTSGS